MTSPQERYEHFKEKVRLGAVEVTSGQPLKSRPDLFAANALALAGEVLAFGETKYPGQPWKQMTVEDHLAATWRHMLEHQAGRTNDTETNKPHLAHALCRLGMALDQYLTG